MKVYIVRLIDSHGTPRHITITASSAVEAYKTAPNGEIVSSIEEAAHGTEETDEG